MILAPCADAIAPRLRSIIALANSEETKKEHDKIEKELAIQFIASRGNYDRRMVMGLGVMSCIGIVFSIEGDAWSGGFDFDMNIDNARRRFVFILFRLRAPKQGRIVIYRSALIARRTSIYFNLDMT